MYDSKHSGHYMCVANIRLEASFLNIRVAFRDRLSL